MKPYRKNEREHAGLGLGVMVLIVALIWGFEALCVYLWDLGTHLAVLTN